MAHLQKILFLTLSLTGFSLPAIASPELGYEQLQLNLSQQECTEQAYNALRRGRFNIERNVSSNYVIGENRTLKAVIDCNYLSRDVTQALIIVTSNGSRAEVSRLVNQLGNAMDDYVSTRPPSRNYHSPRNSYSPTPISNENFPRFLAALKDSWPNEIEFLSNSARDTYFTSEQVAEIIESFSFKHDQEDAAVVLYPRVVDKSNWFIVYDAFTFSFSRNEVMRRIEEQY